MSARNSIPATIISGTEGIVMMFLSVDSFGKANSCVSLIQQLRLFLQRLRCRHPNLNLLERLPVLLLNLLERLPVRLLFRLIILGRLRILFLLENGCDIGGSLVLDSREVS